MSGGVSVCCQVEVLECVWKSLEVTVHRKVDLVVSIKVAVEVCCCFSVSSS
jgi:hypothetical protein